MTVEDGALRATLRHVAQDLRAHADVLNELDGTAGDGDLGVTMNLAAEAVTQALDETPDGSTEELLRSCGAAVARHAPSTSGTLVATGLLRSADVQAPDGTPAQIVSIRLASAVAGIQERGGAEVGSRTMVDALAPARDAAHAAASSGRSLAETIRAAAAAADEGATATATMQAKHGRAGWLGDRAAGHEDAGARMVAIVLASAAAHVDAAGLGH